MQARRRGTSKKMGILIGLAVGITVGLLITVIVPLCTEKRDDPCAGAARTASDLAYSLSKYIEAEKYSDNLRQVGVVDELRENQGNIDDIDAQVSKDTEAFMAEVPKCPAVKE